MVKKLKGNILEENHLAKTLEETICKILILHLAGWFQAKLVAYLHGGKDLSSEILGDPEQISGWFAIAGARISDSQLFNSNLTFAT